MKRTGDLYIVTYSDPVRVMKYLKRLQTQHQKLHKSIRRFPIEKTSMAIKAQLCRH